MLSIKRPTTPKKPWTPPVLSTIRLPDVTRFDNGNGGDGSGINGHSDDVLS